jgi:hypothetical protein
VGSVMGDYPAQNVVRKSLRNLYRMRGSQKN